MQHLSKISWCLILFLGNSRVFADYVVPFSTPSPDFVEKGVCEFVGDEIKLKGKKGHIGMIDVALDPRATTNVGMLYAIENPKHPQERVYLGYAGLNRQSQIFDGEGLIECSACTGSYAQDPNDREKPCPDPNNPNYCAECKKVPCKGVVTITRCQSGGADGRAQKPATAAAPTSTSSGFAPVPDTLYKPRPPSSLINRLELVEPPKEVPTSKP